MTRNLGSSPRQNCPQRASIRGYSFLKAGPVAEPNLEVVQLIFFFFLDKYAYWTQQMNHLQILWTPSIQGRKEDAPRLFTGSRALVNIILFLLSWKHFFLEEWLLTQTRAFSLQNYCDLCNGESEGSLDLGSGTLKWTLENNLSAIFRESSKNSLSGKGERSNRDQLPAEFIPSHGALSSVFLAVF